jgi:transposase
MTKSPMMKYTIKQFLAEFPDDTSCLEWLKDYRFPNGIFCKNCQKVTTHHLMTTRKSYSCQTCGNHVHPTAGTVFHKSSTALTTWFYTAFLMSQTRGGISAKQIQRETGVTYKTAWRMCHEIRKMLSEDFDPFGGEVEVDESYFGGKSHGTRGRGAEGKTAVFGMVQRGGKVEARTVRNVKSKTIMPIVADNIQKGTQIFSDEFRIYQALPAMGYEHATVPHAEKIYVLGNVHTNTIEGFWSLTKNGIRGVYHAVSSKHLQHYLNEYAFRYNHRDDVTPMFFSFLHRSASVVSAPVSGD